MAFDGLTINNIVTDLDKKLKNLKVDKISQAERDEILITFRGGGSTHKLLISASAALPRLYLVQNYKKENPLKAPNFLMLLRKYIQGGRVLSVRQDNFDRTVFIDIDTYDELKIQKIRTLIIEIMGRHSNIILVDKESNKILDSAKRVPISVSSFREVLPAITYKLPPAQEKLSPVDNITLEEFVKKICTNQQIFKSLYTVFSGLSPMISKEICYRSGVDENVLASDIEAIKLEKLYSTFTRMMSEIKNENFEPCIVEDNIGNTIDFSCVYLSMYEGYKIRKSDDISEICENYYDFRDTKDRINQRSQDVRKTLSNKISTLENKIEKQVEEISQTVKANEYKKDADLLTAYIYTVEKGLEQVVVDDFYDENTPKKLIKLDVNLTPSENVQRLYKKYNKLKTRKKELSVQIENGKLELEYLYNLELSIENAKSQIELEEIISEMQSQGVIKQRKSDNKKKKIQSEFSPMKFMSEDGYEIFVGKNNNQNDYLTLKYAKSDDMWLHTKNIAGSHGIIKSQKGEVSDLAIKQTAIICAFYSKAKYSQSVPVDYTIRKNVKKPNGAKPGMVIYETNSTIYVTPDEALVEKLRIKE